MIFLCIYNYNQPFRSLSLKPEKPHEYILFLLILCSIKNIVVILQLVLSQLFHLLILSKTTDNESLPKSNYGMYASCCAILLTES